jgi:hypothetical protein
LICASIAASADLHPGGFDKNCSLCQFSKAPLIKACLELFVPPDYAALWELQVAPVDFQRALVVYSGMCRAPPSLVFFSS